MMHDGYEQSIRALQLTGMGERTQEAYTRMESGVGLSIISFNSIAWLHWTRSAIIFNYSSSVTVAHRTL